MSTRKLTLEEKVKIVQEAEQIGLTVSSIYSLKTFAFKPNFG